MNENIKPLAVDLKAAGKVLGVSPHTVRRRAKVGELDWYIDGKMMIVVASIEAYVARKVEQSVTREQVA